MNGMILYPTDDEIYEFIFAYYRVSKDKKWIPYLEVHDAYRNETVLG